MTLTSWRSVPYYAVAALNLTTRSAGTRPRSLHLESLRFGPLADFGDVRSARRAPASAPGRPTGTAAGPPGSLHITGQRVPQLLSMPGIQVDLILRVSVFNRGAAGAVPRAGRSGRPGPLRGSGYFP